MMQPKDILMISKIDTVVNNDLVAPFKERLRVEDLAILIMDFEGYNDILSALKGKRSFNYALN